MKRWLAMLGMAAAACSPSLPLALPAAPPPRTPSELGRWRTPPPLSPQAPARADWQLLRERLPNGLGVTVVSLAQSETLALVLDVPAAADASDGLVSVTAEALRAGTRTRAGTLVVNPRHARQPISIRTDATGTTFSWQVLPRASDSALAMLADFVLHPAFDARQTRVVLQQELARIQHASSSLWHLANLARGALAGIDLPTPWSDALGLLEATPERLRDVHRCALQLRGAELVVVGPAPASELLASVRAAFAAPRVARPSASECRLLPQLPSLAGVAPNTRVELQIVYGGTFDPYVVLALPGPPPSSPDFLPFMLASEVLDRRDSEAQGLRHTGATYGIDARINEGFPGGSLLELAGQVAPDKAQAALRTLVTEIRNLHATLGAEELENVKRRHESVFSRGLSNNLELAAAMLGQLRRGKPPEMLASWANELRSVSLERCREVAAKWLRRAEPSIAVAGLPVPLVRGLGFRANVRRLYWTERLQAQKKAL